MRKARKSGACQDQRYLICYRFERVRPAISGTGGFGQQEIERSGQKPQARRRQQQSCKEGRALIIAARLHHHQPDAQRAFAAIAA